MNERSKMLAEEKISKLLYKLSTPAMVGMMVQALYNLVDTIFVGKGIGTDAIAAIAITFPIQMIGMSISQSIGVGSASIVSRSLGSGTVERAEQALGNMLSIIFLLSILATILGSIFIVPLLQLFGATKEILPYAVDYMNPIILGTIFFTFAMSTNNIVRAEGNAKVAMITMIISGGLNVILDPIFIFGLNMGIKGAALATVLSQASTAVYLLYYFLKGKSGLRFYVKNLKLDFSIFKEIFAIGSSELVRMGAGSLMMVILNNSLVFYGGNLSVAVFGIINRLLMFLFMPMFGIVQGLQPIIGFNYGANKLQRAKSAIYLAMVVATIMSVVGSLVLIIFPEQLLGIFSSDQELISSGSKAMRIIILGLPVVGFQVIGAGMFQAFGKAVPSFILSMLRQILFLIPLVVILPKFYNLNGIWAAFPIADLLSALFTLIFVVMEMRLLNKSITTEELVS